MFFRSSLLLLFCLSIAQGLQLLPAARNSVSIGNVKLQEADGKAGIIFSVEANGTLGLRGQLGLALPQVVDASASECEDPSGSDYCLEWGDYAQLKIRAGKPDNGNCAVVEWLSTFGRRLEDCFDLVDGEHWYGGIQMYDCTYPLETQRIPEKPSVVGADSGAINENYWFTTLGFGIHVPEDVPLFISVNTTHKNQICFVSKDEHPYRPRGEVRLKYEMCGINMGENLLDLHRRSLLRNYEKPAKLADLNMILLPYWSTWAQYHRDINETLVLQYAQRIKDEGFSRSSHIQIDDDWETCYGETEFNPMKFPDPGGMVSKIKEMGFRLTLWTHLYINVDCPSFKTAFKNNFFVRDIHDHPGMVAWWNPGLTGVVDFTNPEAVDWWTARLRKLQEDFGIDSFKFDGGDLGSLPASVKFVGGDETSVPNLQTTKFVETAAEFGGLVELRVARRNQKEGVFFRMQDKNSHWGYDSGLRSMIPTLNHISILGYAFCLPDMIGGNAYAGLPSKELYIRWAQLNVLMASMQFSIVPWEYDDETVIITKQVVTLREKFELQLTATAYQALNDGTPMNRPMWFVDPEDKSLYTIDDQYMLGDSVMIAPVVWEGATARDIYVPKGVWRDLNNQDYEGPRLYRDIPAPLDTVPIFVKV